MIIKNNFNKSSNDFLQEEKKGLDKAINKLDERFKKGELESEVFLKQNKEFAKKQIDLKKRMDKLNRY